MSRILFKPDITPTPDLKQKALCSQVHNVSSTPHDGGCWGIYCENCILNTTHHIAFDD